MSTLLLQMTMMAQASSANPMTLTGALPNATVGAAYTGHLTLGGAFTGPVTIGASVGSIPAWMTVAVTGTDVAFTGTPAAGDVATDTFTVRATDSTTPTAQVATSAQSVVVSAASTAPVFVQINSAHAASGTSLAVTLTAAPTSGNLLVASFRGSGTINAPAGWTAAGTNSGVAQFQTFYKLSDGSETTTTFTCSGSGNMGATVAEWKGAKIGTFTSGTASLASRTATFGSTDAPIGANSMPMMFLNGTCNYQISLTYSSPWVGQQVPNVAGTYNEPYSCYQTTGPNAAVSGTVTAGNTQTYLAPYWNHVWIDPA